MSREMKNSGVPWIGEIPRSWSIMPHKRVMHKVKEIQEHYNGENILSLTMRGVIVRDLDAGGKMPTTFDGYQKVYPNNLLQCLFDIDVTPRCVGLIKDEGLTSPAYSQFTMYSNGYAPYYDYLLRYMDDRKTLLHLSKNLRSSLTETDFGAILTCVPPIAEQKKIAEYLDKKCGEVDEMIALQEQIIEELKTYKQSVITEAVTKGLNPNVPMKDSGIDWIGEIPEHWEVVKLKFYASIDSGDAISNEQIDNDGEYPVFGGGEIMGYYSQYNTDEDKLIIGRVGARCGCVTMPKQKSWASDNALVLKSCLPLKYTYHLLQAINLNRLNTSNAQPLITATKIKNVFIPLTPITEQQSIADYLDKKCGEIDTLISIKQRKIESLKEYKKSIIYEYVTGKKEVE